MSDVITLNLTKAEAETLYSMLIETPMPYKVSGPLIAKMIAAAQRAAATAKKAEPAAPPAVWPPAPAAGAPVEPAPDAQADEQPANSGQN